MIPTDRSLDKAPFIEIKKKLIPYKMALQNKCLPFDEGVEGIYVAYVDPYPFEAFEAMSALLSKNLIPYRVDESDLLKALELCYQHTEGETRALMEQLGTEVSKDKKGEEDSYDLLDENESSQVIRIVNAIFLEAVQIGASDIHFEPSEKGLMIRYRVDGVLIKRHNPPKDIEAQIIARVKVLAQLDIAETRLPQDGRLKIKINQRSIDFRVSSIPVSFGERIVLRILDKSHLSLSLEKLDMPPSILEALIEAIEVPEGMLLVTGPTGSGKTTTLYSILNRQLQEPINIMTIEDPVEYRFSGMAQMSVNPKIQLSFASGLKHILRQDPDVIMIGEIRDFETAEIAIQSSLTGHRVYSTLHTNDAPSAITRLVDMGIEPYLVSSSLTGVLAQRLMRKICPSCRIQVPLSPALKGKFPLVDASYFYKGAGCDECFYTGYRGRIGVYEFLPMTSALRKQILLSQDADSLTEVAMAGGFQSLRTHALALAQAGITTLEEVLSVTKGLS